MHDGQTDGRMKEGRLIHIANKHTLIGLKGKNRPKEGGRE